MLYLELSSLVVKIVYIDERRDNSRYNSRRLVLEFPSGHSRLLRAGSMWTATSDKLVQAGDLQTKSLVLLSSLRAPPEQRYLMAGNVGMNYDQYFTHSFDSEDER